ncbi:hypothetical protein L198_01750 [Cryptococcus wingfieldii CBS 7118]|uniref:Uncharacterized protein n=1 Tax=Cryptococcus wingfieldii CBS 7118 TaxID=1295528 RepID=A0A1E3JW92_9TREE|nr:hypothetical protein L198_01750 [Cryptococcus wingfieldii CBS 7118]ODO05063.1 hypothetical protein L198_01750 [Cryptococcus wingfieldii CBS 7118]
MAMSYWWVMDSISQEDRWNLQRPIPTNHKPEPIPLVPPILSVMDDTIILAPNINALQKIVPTKKPRLLVQLKGPSHSRNGHLPDVDENDTSENQFDQEADPLSDQIILLTEETEEESQSQPSSNSQDDETTSNRNNSEHRQHTYVAPWLFTRSTSGYTMLIQAQARNGQLLTAQRREQRFGEAVTDMHHHQPHMGTLGEDQASTSNKDNGHND